MPDIVPTCVRLHAQRQRPGYQPTTPAEPVSIQGSGMASTGSYSYPLTNPVVQAGAADSRPVD
jgi:hypothetical protein